MNAQKIKNEPSNSVRLTDNEVLKEAKKICIDKNMSVGAYVTEAIRKENKKNGK